MVFFKKKQPTEQPRALSPQDFQSPEMIPMDNISPQGYIENPPAAVLPQRRPNPIMPMQPEYPQPMQQPVQQLEMDKVPREKALQIIQQETRNPQPMQMQPQYQQQPTESEQIRQIINAIQDAILELDGRISNIESWLFRRTK